MPHVVLNVASIGVLVGSALKTEGLFRVPGSAVDINNVHKLYMAKSTPIHTYLPTYLSTYILDTYSIAFVLLY
jgi:hypothetical protein